jgi:alpha-L-fucosidase 2
MARSGAATVAKMLGALVASTSVVTVLAQQSPVTLDLDFASFLGRCDPLWKWNTTSTMPGEYVQSLFGGNGDLGFMVWSPTLTSIRIDVSRTVVYDDRVPGMPSFLNNFVYDQPRLPIGHFVLTWSSGADPVTGLGRLSLFDGTASLNITTPSGALSLRVWASAEWETADVIAVETDSSGGEVWQVSFVPEAAVSTWNSDASYVPNPPPINTTSSPAQNQILNLTSQPHLRGTGHTTAVLSISNGAGSPATTTFLTISPVQASVSASDAWATAQVAAAAQTGVQALYAAHTAWWNAFWPAGGMVFLDYSVLESFFYIQIYKFASAARAGRAVHDLMGPFFVDGTPWPDLHWDMNLQQTYYLPIAANRPDTAHSIVEFLDSIRVSGALSNNLPSEWTAQNPVAYGAPTGASSLSGNMSCYWNYGPNCTTSPPSIMGNLLWAIQVAHLAGLYSGNDTVQTAVVWPLLTGALNTYQFIQIPPNGSSGDGLTHLPVTFSPEYPGPPGPDANYDLALLHWGLRTAFQLSAQYNLTNEYMPAWNTTLASLVGYSVDNASNTFEIYRGVPYGTPHRHYSHLFMIWPLRALNFSDPAQHLTAKLSVDRWLATPEEDSQFYRPAASAMNVMLGQRAAAFDNITYLLHTRIEANTFYREGSQGLCMETPYAAAWAVCDWFVQSWNASATAANGAAVLEFFPAVDDVIALDDTSYTAAPAKVAAGSFYRLGTEGGFLVSGSRALVSQNQTHFVTRTDFVAVESTKGGDVIVRTNMQRPLAVSPVGVTIEELGDGGLVRIGIAAGQGAALYSTAFPTPTFVVSPSMGCPADYNYWGFPARAQSATPPYPPPDAQAVYLAQCQYGSDGKASPAQRFAFTQGGSLAIQDGSGRCLATASCSAAAGALAVLVPCEQEEEEMKELDQPIGCEASCAAAIQKWTLSGPSAAPPNAFENTAASLCLDVNGAITPDVVDVWTCDNPPGAYKNLEWAYNATTGAFLTLDTYPGVAGLCLTPKPQ